MKAMQFRAFGSLESLRPVSLPRPEPGPGEVLIEVTALSVNPVDWKLRSGLLRWLSPLRFPTIPCFDYAGHITAIGTGIETFRVGERVFGLCASGDAGSARERIAVHPGAWLTRTPEGITDEEAAGVPLAGLTALQALNAARPLCAGQRVIIVGASGGVGHYAVQIAKALGASVTAVCSTRHVGWVRELGADAVLDYTRGDLDQPSAGYDRVVDAVSLGSFRRWRQWLQPEGTYVTLLARGDVLWQQLTAPGGAGQQARSILLRPLPGQLQTLADWMSTGRLRTVIDSEWSLDQLLSALRKSRAGHARGKIIVRAAH